MTSLNVERRGLQKGGRDELLFSIDCFQCNGRVRLGRDVYHLRIQERLGQEINRNGGAKMRFKPCRDCSKRYNEYLKENKVKLRQIEKPTPKSDYPRSRRTQYVHPDLLQQIEAVGKLFNCKKKTEAHQIAAAFVAGCISDKKLVSEKQKALVFDRAVKGKIKEFKELLPRKYRKKKVPQ